MSEAKYKRVLLKLSGEALAGEQKTGANCSGRNGPGAEILETKSGLGPGAGSSGSSESAGWLRFFCGARSGRTDVDHARWNDLRNSVQHHHRDTAAGRAPIRHNDRR